MAHALIVLLIYATPSIQWTHFNFRIYLFSPFMYPYEKLIMLNAYNVAKSFIQPII